MVFSFPCYGFLNWKTLDKFTGVFYLINKYYIYVSAMTVNGAVEAKRGLKLAPRTAL